MVMLQSHQINNTKQYQILNMGVARRKERARVPPMFTHGRSQSLWKGVEFIILGALH